MVVLVRESSKHARFEIFILSLHPEALEAKPTAFEEDRGRETTLQGTGTGANGWRGRRGLLSTVPGSFELLYHPNIYRRQRQSYLEHGDVGSSFVVTLD
jgi:hypothetical protein